ncbi:hypothetical protein BD779DRAFT_1511303 [Infundibulicybe gibba]|nr:hypothetical protein BD779DRAFT_1511303 [Infundibulicybe gibba]
MQVCLDSVPVQAILLNGDPLRQPSLLDNKSSRKREREVSLEPVAAPVAAADGDPLHREHKETRTPAKKNRTRLDTTEEEDVFPRSRSNSQSPPLSVSPPQEMKMKVRQISQGVEDLSWRNMNAIANENEMEHEFVHADNTPMPAQACDTQRNSAERRSKSPPESQHSPSDMDDATAANDPDNAPSRSASRRSSDSDTGEKGLKRKFLDRGTSLGPQENGDSTSVVEAIKRPRDDSDKDDNPREAKRLTPPPEAKVQSPPPAQTGGFMAYASARSPFAEVKGQNIFSSNKHSSPPPYTFPANASGSLGESSKSTSVGPMRTGFGAFASTSSPFAAAARSKASVIGSPKLSRTKSPQRRTNPSNVNAFSSYASSGTQSFSTPIQKRQRAASPGRGSSSKSPERNSDSTEEESDSKVTSFGEKLRAGRDDEEGERSEEENPRIVLTEQDVTTGEEDEETLHQVRGKLFFLDGNQWKERGTGLLKLNVRMSDGGGARLVMRKEAVYTLLLNVTLFHGMRCAIAQDPRYLRFSVIEGGATTHYNLRVSNAKIAQELLEEINTNIPPPLA